jgi:ribonucleoside-diphosphate reductase alpha chain
MANVDLSQRVVLVGQQKGVKIPRLFTREGQYVYDSVEWESRTSMIKNPDGTIVFKLDNVEVPKFWSQTATDILAQKYFRKKGVPQFDAEGNPILDENSQQKLGSETSLKQTVHRLAGCWTQWGKKHSYFSTEEDAQAFYDEVAYMLLYQYCAPNSPQWFNTGLNYAYGITGPAQGHWYVDPETLTLQPSKDAYTRVQAHACFIQPIRDDLVNDGGILDLAVREARIFKYGSGTGTNFSTLRARGEPLAGGGKSSGVLSFLKIFDTVAGAIKSGGTTRRAAKMVVLNIDHPEIESFVRWKADEERKFRSMVDSGIVTAHSIESAGDHVSGQNSNNSVRVTDEFMQAVIEDENWNLIARMDGSVMKTVKARDLWNSIAQAAWECADPGVQFDTTYNDWHTGAASGRINATNPCSEYSYLDNTACNLASLNLEKFLVDGTFDVETFKHATRLWTMVLELSVLMAHLPSKEIAKLTYEHRTLGLGYTNLGSILMLMGIPYDSDKARAIAAAITATMTGESYSTSAELAAVLNPFPAYEENKEHMLRVMRNHRRAAYNAPAKEYEGVHNAPPGIEQGYCPAYLLDAAKECWDRAVALGELYGYRNAQTTLIAPTGTISFVMDADTTGIEPDFALVKFKKLVGGGYFKIVNKMVAPALKNLGYSADQVLDIVRYIVGRNTFDGAPYISRVKLKSKGFTDLEIDKMEKLLQGALDLSFVFNVSSLGKDCLKRLGFSEDQYSKPDFNLLKAMGFRDDEIDAATEFICGTQMIEGAPHLKQEHYPIFDCANTCGKRGTRFIEHMAHVKMMAATQPFLSGSISKTINMPSDATVEDIQKVYMESWKLGLKSLALYRDGSKAVQPLSVYKEKKKEEFVAKRRKLPAERQAIAHKFTVGNQEGYLHVGLFEDGAPGEIFITMAKQGSTLSGLMDAFALAVSVGLQYGVPLKVLVSKYLNSRFDPMGWTDNPQIPVAKSIIDYMFRWMAFKFLKEADLVELGLLKTENLVIENGRVEDLDNNSRMDAQLTMFTDGSSKSKSMESNGDSPMCKDCGVLMVKAGSCHTCPSCGVTSGCS